MRRRRRRTAFGAGSAPPAAALVAVCLLAALAGCSGGGGSTEAGADTTSTALVTTTTEPPPVAPLTGLPMERSKAYRPALTVKIDNAPQARPQSGLDRADTVFEEVVEGGVVRFMAVFHSQDAVRVGPVRSVRPVDPDIVAPLRGLFAYSGGAPQFVRMIKRAPVTLVGFDELTRAYTKRRDRPAPHHLYSSTEALYRGAPSSATPPVPLYAFSPAPFTAGGATPANRVVVNISGATTAIWDYDTTAAIWRRTTNGTPHTVEGGPQLGFTNVIVQFVPYRNTGSRDPAGFPVVVADVLGSGPALVLSGGQAVRGRWTKGSVGSVTTFTDAVGAPLALQPGTTWVTFAPTQATTSVKAPITGPTVPGAAVH